MEISTKICNTCGIEKPHKSFPTKTLTGKRSNKCGTCKGKVRRKNNPLLERSKALRYKYGMTIQDYDNMYSNQQGLCKICGDHYPKLLIDHCHDSQAVRGLLCNYCNTVLGMSKDRIDILNRAILYLKDTNTDKS